ncbi:MAG TPA: NAD-dependent epimerase/dehydratase family protein, partial [Crocinitomicaceae bacterium]|nr:NAD-dependent epimerase/dehydratase family protein [Crocinitomicaceae bacterium]
AAYKFMKAIDSGKSITLYNDGNVYRDFTHVSDVVHAIRLLAKKITSEKAGFHQIFNIGYGSPISVKKYAELIAQNLDKKLYYNSAVLPLNELMSTHSDMTALQSYIGCRPNMTIENGIAEMVDWFKHNNYESSVLLP